MHTPVVKPAGIAGQVGTTGFHNLRVHLHQVDTLNTVVTRQLAHNTAVAGTNDKNIPDSRMDRHRDMGNHFIIYEFIPLSQHNVSVER